MTLPAGAPSRSIEWLLPQRLKSKGSADPRSASSSVLRTVSSTIGPAPTCCARRWPTPREAAPSACTRTTTCLCLKVIKKFLDAGLALPAARRAVECLRQAGDDLAAANIVLSDASSVLANDNDELIDLVKGGQGVLNIFPMAGVVDGTRRRDRGAWRVRRARESRRQPVTGHRLGAPPNVAAAMDGGLRHAALESAHAESGRQAGRIRRLADARCLSRPAPCTSTAPVARARWCSTSATSARCACEGDGRLRTAAVGADQRPAQDRARPGAVHAPARRRRFRSSTTSSCGGSTTTTFDVMPNASNTDRVVASLGGVDTTATRSHPRRARPQGAIARGFESARPRPA